ncbi:SDR family oxidoreductase [Pseudoalteromonas sp. MMG013]|uniref:SDR family oxidoreductase n=1 Tax=Pseudoalteromonas sp. MMG013 TaxID=2822687 RepID=UPI001B387421|nr:SDR family oxidoreductase [Pseudoalteromonas sp. MMG013]MBQ4860603.1 SDR family oxidoreductase [Pseudoalteromonas sp. MMG013]
MKTVLITGANRGIGFALTTLYLRAGWQVLATCRDPKSAEALQSLTLRYRSLTIFTLDITNYAQVTQLALQLQGQPIDVLLNNAGIYGPQNYGFGHCDTQAWQDVFETNVIAPIKLAEAFVAHIKSSELKVIAAISSKVGSHTENTKGGGYIYRSSKAALNSAIKSLSNDLLPEGIKTVSLHPGWVKTSMGGPNALIEADESAQGLKYIIDNLQDAQSGGFYSYTGDEIPW